MALSWPVSWPRPGVLLAFLSFILLVAPGRLAVAGEPSPWERFQADWPGTGAGGRGAALARLLDHVRGLGGVVCSGDTMTFFHLVPGTRRLPRVELCGDFTGWGPPVRMTRFADTRLFTFTLPGLPLDTRLEYKFRVGGEERLDPLNPITVPNGIGGTNSVAIMPGYRRPAPLAPGSTRLAGRLETHEFRSRISRTVRQVAVYLPPGYRREPQRRFPTVYVHDGGAYLRYAGAAVVVDRLVTLGRIEPLIAVFVDPVDRWTEYDSNAVFTRMFVEELVGFVDGRYRTVCRADRRLVLGASMGGRISLHLAASYPGVFGLVASQSGAFGRARRNPVAALAGGPLTPIRVYADVGLFDLKGGRLGLLDENRALRKVLETRRYPLLYREFAGGHNYTCWADQLPTIFEHFFGTGAGPAVCPPGRGGGKGT
ncbi:MAG: hypothetical protein HY815_07790 [Candidatus Riflebacteria bacterium]|nr:hypothetical protein [Candidatus Riflebacteria bacterium]